MPVILNTLGESHANALIAGGNFESDKPWFFSAEDRTKLLGEKGDDWPTYAMFNLGEDSDAPDSTVQRWKFPYAKGGKVSKNALLNTRQRAAKLGATAVYDATCRLLAKLDAQANGTVVNRGVPQARATQQAGLSGYKMIAAKDNSPAEIYLYGIIGGGGLFGPSGISANQFRQDLKALGDVKAIDIHVNSEGGDVFEGKAIYSQLAQHPARINMIVDGLAASAASFICMAGNTIAVNEGGFMMIHRAWSFAMGTSEDLRKTADLLDAVDGTLADVYAARSGQDVATVKQMMSDETWMTAEQCKEMGFADKIIQNVKVTTNVVDPGRFKNLPAALRPNRIAALRSIGATDTTDGDGDLASMEHLSSDMGDTYINPSENQMMKMMDCAGATKGTKNAVPAKVHVVAYGANVAASSDAKSGPDVQKVVENADHAIVKGDAVHYKVITGNVPAASPEFHGVPFIVQDSTGAPCAVGDSPAGLRKALGQ